jgi:hypothetical protein
VVPAAPAGKTECSSVAFQFRNSAVRQFRDDSAPITR